MIIQNGCRNKQTDKQKQCRNDKAVSQGNNIRQGKTLANINKTVQDKTGEKVTQMIQQIPCLKNYKATSEIN